MGLTPYIKENFLAGKNIPHYFEVKLKDHPNGLKKVHCGTIEDVERVLEINPGSTVTQIFPPIPQTVDVPHIIVKDQELPMQQYLPQSELQELFS